MTAYELRISDWSSDVCSSDLSSGLALPQRGRVEVRVRRVAGALGVRLDRGLPRPVVEHLLDRGVDVLAERAARGQTHAVVLLGERCAHDLKDRKSVV